MLEWTTWGSDGVTIPEGVQEMTGFDTQCLGLISKVEFFQEFRLDGLGCLFQP